MADEQIVQAAVNQPVSGTTAFGIDQINQPTPNWVRTVVRSLTWVTAIYGLLSLTVDLRDFGVSEHTATLILKYAASFTGLISVLARFVGVKPPSFDRQ